MPDLRSDLERLMLASIGANGYFNGTSLPIVPRTFHFQQQIGTGLVDGGKRGGMTIFRIILPVLIWMGTL